MHIRENKSLVRRPGPLGVSLAVFFLAAFFLKLAPLYAEEGAGEVTDVDIGQAIEMELDDDPAVDSQLIDVSLDNGTVTLSGAVDNIMAKDRAVKDAEATRGVLAVVDQLEVLPVPRKDDEIRGDVLEALRSDPAAGAYKVKVDVRKGAVSLSGSVASWPEKQLAGDIAKGVRGVRSLANDIRVTPPKAVTDAGIRTAVERRLEGDVLVEDKLIQVEVKDGAVKLKGAVGSAAEKSEAEFDAWTAGVKSVDAKGLAVDWRARDRMRRYAGTAGLTDEKIRAAVGDALLYDPRLWSFEPQIKVENGVVTLSGKVGDLAAKWAAGDDALDVIGVRRVRNFIKVRPAERVGDDELINGVSRAIQRDPYLDRYSITVTARNGKVRLSGAVGNDFEKTRAVYAAYRAPGTAAVDDQLITPVDWKWKDDWAIIDDVRSLIFWTPYLDRDDVKVTVEGGTVGLDGTVDSWFERRTAAEKAWEGGARFLLNRLKVRGFEQR